LKEFEKGVRDLTMERKRKTGKTRNCHEKKKILAVGVGRIIRKWCVMKENPFRPVKLTNLNDQILLV